VTEFLIIEKTSIGYEPDFIFCGSGDRARSLPSLPCPLDIFPYFAGMGMICSAVESLRNIALPG
jgi:hypothetical protein